MNTKKTLIAIIIAIIILTVIFIVFKDRSSVQEEGEEVSENYQPEDDEDFQILKSALNKTIRDLDLNLGGECRNENDQYWCEGGDAKGESCANFYSFRIGAVRKNYGSWADYWDILLNKGSKFQGEDVAKRDISGIESYLQTVYEGPSTSEKCAGSCSAGNYKKVWETASSYFKGYSLTATIDIEGTTSHPAGSGLVACIGSPDRIGRFSAWQIMEQLIANVKRYY